MKKAFFFFQFVLKTAIKQRLYGKHFSNSVNKNWNYIQGKMVYCNFLVTDFSFGKQAHIFYTKDCSIPSECVT